MQKRQRRKWRKNITGIKEIYFTHSATKELNQTYNLINFCPKKQTKDSDVLWLIYQSMCPNKNLFTILPQTEFNLSEFWVQMRMDCLTWTKIGWNWQKTRGYEGFWRLVIKMCGLILRKGEQYFENPIKNNVNVEKHEISFAPCVMPTPYKYVQAECCTSIV